MRGRKRRPVDNRPAGRAPGRRRRISKVEGNPTIVRGVVVAVLTLLGGLGFTWAADVDEKTIGLLVTVIAALVPIVQAMWTRLAVTPDVKVISRVTTTGEVVTGPAADLPVGTLLDSDVRAPVRPELVEDAAHTFRDGVLYDRDGDDPIRDPFRP